MDDAEKILRRFQHLKSVALDDAEYGKESPILPAHERSVCRRCGASYNAAQFMELALPHNGKGVWKFESATFAVRQCRTHGCDNTLGRRVA